MEVFSSHRDLWSRRLGTIKATHQTIDLQKGTRSISRQPYRARERSQEILCHHINKQLEARVIDPAQFEWANPLVLIPKKDGILHFLLTIGASTQPPYQTSIRCYVGMIVLTA